MMGKISKHFVGLDRSWQLSLALSLSCFLMAFLLSQGELQRQREALAGRLAPSVLRFHILAESDKKADQQIKLEVRSLILDYLKEHLSDNPDKETTIACLEQNKEEIVKLANRHLKERGFDYQTDLELTNCYFPTRSYGQLVFPCGYYDAARITLGKGKGHNWWCVLYPRFCFVDASCSGIPRESSMKLREEIKESDYLALENNFPDIEIRFFFFPGLTPHSDDNSGTACAETPTASCPEAGHSTAAKPSTPQS